MMAFRILFLLPLCLVLAPRATFAATVFDLGTSDGLTLRLDAETGRPTGVALDDQSLPLLPLSPTGLLFREFEPVVTTRTLLFRDFDSASIDWNSARNADWNTAAVYYERIEGGGVGNSGYLRLGNGVALGCGIAFPEAFPVAPFQRIRIRWMGRAADVAAKTILCLRLFNAAGEDVTPSIAPPGGWTWSATSQAHCVFGMTNTIADAWQPFSYEYTVPDGVSSATLSLRYWRDGDFHVDVDDLSVELAGGITGREWTVVEGPVTPLGDGRFEQVVATGGAELSLRVLYEVSAGAIRCGVTIDDLGVPMRSRPLRLQYRLPVDATGWFWGDNILARREIQAGQAYSFTYTLAERAVSYYPWGCVGGDAGGLALGAPMSVPRLQEFAYSDADGLRTRVDLCLSPSTLVLGPGRATFSFLLYRFEPRWGFRAAAAKHHSLFPELFIGRETRQGCWEYPVAPTLVLDPQDFGFAFFECYPQTQAVRDRCAELGIGLFHYLEPWGAWQSYGTLVEKPPYQERMARLEEWAAEATTTLKWLRAPRNETARGVLNSAYRDPDGRTLIDANAYFWHAWNGTTSQLWPCYPNPDFPPESLSRIHKDLWIDATAGERDGMYIDSILTSSPLGNLLDFNEDHFAHVRTPLVFSLANGRPALLSAFAQYDFLNWLYDYEHAGGRTVMGNLFAPAYRFHAHQLDVMGSELFDVTESDAYAALRRTLSGAKVNTNLLQWFRGDQFVTHDEIHAYILNQMFWGFYPGVASCGGGIDFGQTLERYFLHPELYERDRSLFRKYLPVIRALAVAGWEPIPFAEAAPAEVRMERFGRWDDANLHFTLRNDAATTQVATLTLDVASLNIAPPSPDVIEARLLPETTLLVPRAGFLENQVQFDVPLGPGAVRAVALTRRPEPAARNGLQVF